MARLVKTWLTTRIQDPHLKKQKEKAKQDTKCPMRPNKTFILMLSVLGKQQTKIAFKSSKFPASPNKTLHFKMLSRIGDITF